MSGLQSLFVEREWRRILEVLMRVNLHAEI